MMLYLSRHGEASHSGPGSPSSLTPRGKSEAARMAEHLVQQKKIKATLLWHSPKIRAVQTAEIYRMAFGGAGLPMEEKDWLEPDGDINTARREILALKGGSLIIVSHLPFLPNLAVLLLEGAAESSLSFPTAGWAALELAEKPKFLWSLDPSSLT